MSYTLNKSINLIVIGTSQGGFEALKVVLAPLPADFPVPILVVRHQPADSGDYLISALNKVCKLTVKFAEEDERPKPATVYLAPPDRHLLVGEEGILRLSADEPVNHSRPAIDPLFISAAKFSDSRLLAVVLTGANIDGTDGVIEVKKHGGSVLIQDVASAEADIMPAAAQAAVDADYVVWLDQIGPTLWTLTR